MSDTARGETFLARWSRVKTEARDTAATPPAPASAGPAKAEDPPPELPPVEELTIDSDFKAFLHPKVDENVRRSALRKLFSDPQFNVMDGLDVYIDDYSKSEPIPATMLAGLKQAQRILDWAAEDREKMTQAREQTGAVTPGETRPAIAASNHTEPDPPPHAEAFLNLPPPGGEGTTT